MSESEEQRVESPLQSDRGVTTVSDTVVSSIAGMAAQEVDGIHMGGGASRTAGGVLGSLTGSEGKTSGISVEVGRLETAIDLKMGIEYNKNILQTVEEVRRRITERVEELTGLRIKELNATITDITFPEKGARRRLGPARSTNGRDDSSEEATDTAPEPQTPSVSETTEVEPTEVEPTSRAHTEGSSGPVPEEEVSVEGRPLEEGETAEVRTEEQPTDEASETVTQAETETQAEVESLEESETQAVSESSEEEPGEAETRSETSESESAEARRRRRAEERARRRRERSQDDT